MTSGRAPGGSGRRSAPGSGGVVPDWTRGVRPAEAAAAGELASLGVPVWGPAERRWRPGRYGLVFRSGRRALVLPVREALVSLDMMAAAKCDYLILAAPADDGGGPATAGFVWWFELGGRSPSETVPCRDLQPRPLGDLPEPPLTPLRYVAALVLGSLRLLLAGERPVPPPTDPGSVTGETSPP